jgi:SanA protein
MPGPRRVIAVIAGIAAGGVAGVLALNAYVLIRGDGATREVGAVRHAQVAIVLGAGLNRNGSMSGMLYDRVHQAIALYRAGKVDRILVSGDHGTPGYNEPGAMRRALLAAGIPAPAIFTDHSGFDTSSTVVRARSIFGVHDAIVVTQDFHMARALFLARAAGLDAQGLVTGGSYGNQGTQSTLRELLARVKSVGQGTLHPAVLGGPPHPIGGDGRLSWGPPDPFAR